MRPRAQGSLDDVISAEPVLCLILIDRRSFPMRVDSQNVALVRVRACVRGSVCMRAPKSRATGHRACHDMRPTHPRA